MFHISPTIFQAEAARLSIPAAMIGGAPPPHVGVCFGGAWPSSWLLPFCSLPPEAAEGMPRVRAAGFPRHDGRQGVWGLVMGQWGGLVGSRAARAGGMESVASRFQLHLCGCRVTRTW